MSKVQAKIKAALEQMEKDVEDFKKKYNVKPQ